MKRLLGYFDSVGKIAAAVAAVIAAVSGAVALYYVLRPPPPAEGKASFGADLTPSGPLTLRDFLLAYHQPLDHQYRQEELDATGRYYTVSVSRKGLRDVQTPIVWHLLRWPDNVPVAGFDKQISFAAAPRNDFTCVVRVFIPLPQLEGRYYALIEITQGSFTLAEVKTGAFTGYSGARPANPTQTATVSTTPTPPPRATTGETTSTTAPATTGVTSATTPSETTTVLITPVEPVAPPVIEGGTAASP